MPSSLTVTAKIGPAIQNTALVLGDISSIGFNFAAMVMNVVTNGKPANVKSYDLNGVTTVTCTVSGKDFSFTVS